MVPAPHHPEVAYPAQAPPLQREKETIYFSRTECMVKQMDNVTSEIMYYMKLSCYQMLSHLYSKLL